MEKFVAGLYKIVGDTDESHGDIKGKIFSLYEDDSGDIRGESIPWDGSFLDHGFIICPPSVNYDNDEFSYREWILTAVEKV